MAADPAPPSRWRAWTPIGVHALSVQAVGFSVRPAVAYAALDAGVAPALLGALSASYALAPLILALPVGRLVDRVGERPVLIGGGVLMAAACGVLMAGAQRPIWLIVGLMLAGISHLLCVVGEQTAVAGMSSGSSDNRFAAYTFASSLGQVVGPLLLALGDATPFALMPVMSGALALSGLILLTSFFIGSGPHATDARPAGVAINLLRNKQIRAAIITSGIVMAAVDITLIYLPALGREVGLSVAFVGWVLAVRAMSSMAVRVVTGTMVRVLGRRAVLLSGMAASAVALVAVAGWPNQPVLLVAAVVLGAGLGVCQPVTMATVADMAPVGQRGTAMTLRLLANRLGVVVLPVSVGAAAAGLGAAGVLGATAVVLCVGCVVSVRR
ncbi:MAG: MFS transporter [Mycobacterium sp.]